MPGIDIKISGSPDSALTQQVATALTNLTCSCLDKDPERTTVRVEYLSCDSWFIGNRSLADIGQKSFRLTVTITDETNTKQQKATFHREAYDLLTRLIGNIHPVSNIHVIDCRASAYGYGGVTQEYWMQHQLEKKTKSL